MGDDDKSTPPKFSLHPVYTVTNIQNKVRVLDGTKVSYASWVNLFTLHARGYKVLHHIDGTTAPAKTDPLYAAWCEIDAHVLQWIYGTMSDELLPRVLEADSTAQEAWDRVKNIFLNNKGARAASLESEFHNLKLAKFASFDDYCQRLRELSGQLKDVGAAITDQRLVLQMVRGLPKEYDTVAAYINQTLPNFETARSMIELENHRQSSRDDATTLVASSAPATDSRNWDDAPPSRNNKRGNNGKRGNYKGGNNGGSKNQAKSSSSTTSAPQGFSWGPMPGWPAQWTPPPCPYPTFPGWSGPWQPWPTSAPRSASTRGNSRQSGAAFGQAHVVSDDASQPQQQHTDLAQVFAALQMQPPPFTPAPFYMDTGASSHLSADAGFSEWESDTEEQ